MAKPKFEDLWKNFPDHIKYPRMHDLYMMLGGQAQNNLNRPGFPPDGNTCASRMSIALALSGHKIDEARARNINATTLGTDKGYRIIFRVSELRTYLLTAFGKPTDDNKSPYDDLFHGRKGIVAFGVSGWDDATGHIALYNGTSYREPDHDDYSQFVKIPAKTYKGEFWEMP